MPFTFPTMDEHNALVARVAALEAAAAPSEPEPTPEPMPEPEPTPAPTGFTHGEQVTRTAVGPAGDLPVRTESITLADGAVLENVELHGIVKLDAGARATIRNCRIVGPVGAGSSVYTVRATAGGGGRLDIDDCEIITRTDVTKGLVMWGDASVSVRRTVFRGGTDSVYLNPHNSPGLVDTGDPALPLMRALFEECWFGDVQRYSGSHSDCVQIDGGGYTLLRRCRIMSYNLPIGSDPLITTDGTELASGGLILTQNSTDPNQLSHVAMVDCWAEGGNYTADLAPSDGLPPQSMTATGNKFGLAHRYGALRMPADSVRSGNTWGQSGTTGSGFVVQAGDPLGDDR